MLGRKFMRGGGRLLGGRSTTSTIGHGDRFCHMEQGPNTELEILSRAAERNLTVAMELRATAWELAAAGLRAFRPELSEAEVQAEVRTLFLRASG